ncbi:hypothetical protein SAMN05444166_4357 [Singulisphaera sp. GP187]|uniref:oxidoreductase n=1 Tax=Singulisphaera sp. GP187 TaxID=1882752 RepID=UPI00092604B4|nr:oxidoreductase [Singulisphaera sp. GP187]SIO39674.1 hypothetical protein SAMN05444166_4357 [Singulisphaera sp. GP187]
MHQHFINIAKLVLTAVTISSVGCGNPRDDSIVYKKLTPEEFAKLPPEEQETPEVQENMGAAWKDPNRPEGATNPKGPGRPRKSR